MLILNKTRNQSVLADADIWTSASRMPYGHLSARAPPKLDLFGDRSYPPFNRFTALNQKIVKRAVHNKDNTALK